MDNVDVVSTPQQQGRKPLKLYTGPKAHNADALDFASAKVIAIYRRNIAKDLAARS